MKKSSKWSVVRLAMLVAGIVAWVAHASADGGPTGLKSLQPGIPVNPGTITASGQPLRMGEAVANTFDPRITGLDRPVGHIVTTRNGTSAYQKFDPTSTTGWASITRPAGVGFVEYALARARFLGAFSKFPTVFYDGFVNVPTNGVYPWPTVSLIGSGTVQPSITQAGGVVSLSTGATASSFTTIASGNAANNGRAFVSDLSSGIPSVYVLAVLHFTTTPTANTSAVFELRSAAGGGAVLTCGVQGSVSTSFWTCAYTGGATVTSAAPIDTNYIALEIWGSAFQQLSFRFGFVDSIRTLSTASSSGGPVGPRFIITNGATAANQTLEVDELFIAVPGNSVGTP